MKAKKYLLAFAAAAAVAVCFAGCADGDSSAAELGNTSTTTAASEADSASASEDDNSPVIGTLESVEDPAPAEDLKTAAKISYCGQLLSVGDNYNDYKDKLGDEAGPSQTIESCMTGNPEVVYYYSNINIHTSTEGVIYSIDLGMDALYPGDVGATRDGIRIGTTFADAKELLGEPDSTDEYNYFYEEGTLKLQLSASLEDDNVIGAISVTDASFN